MIFLNSFTLLQRSTVTDGECKYHTSNTVKKDEKNGYGKELDELIQYETWDTKWTTTSGGKSRT